MSAEGRYVFSQSPSAVPNSRKKYRDAPVYTNQKQNIMWDKRVVRGNTYAAQIPTPNQILMAQAEEARRRPKQRRNRAIDKDASMESDEVMPLPGRHNMEVQTDDFLEDLDEAVMEQDVACQTNFVIDVADPVIKYRPQYGVDKYTAIEKGELFAFDSAVEPILATLLGRALDYGLAEVLEEQELEWLEAYQSKFEADRQAVLTSNKQMEAEAMAENEQKEKVMNEERARYKKEKDVAHKVACCAFAKNYLADFQNHVFTELEQSGVFYDPAKKDIEHVFLPWIRDQVDNHLTDQSKANTDVDRIVQRAIKIEVARIQKAQMEAEEEAKRLEAERQARLLAEEEARRALEEEEEEDEEEDSAEDDKTEVDDE